MNTASKPGVPPSSCEVVFSHLGRVCYLRPKESDENDDHYERYCADKIGCADGVQSKDLGAVKAALIELKKCAPFIKHKGFEEEDEYRLIFRNEDGKLSKCIRYRPADSNGIQHPYVVVRPGNPDYDRKPCVVRLCLQEPMLTRHQKAKLRAELKANLPGVKLVDCTQPPDRKRMRSDIDSLCFGCTRRCWINGTSVKKGCTYSKAGVDGYAFGLHDRENSAIIFPGEASRKNF